jgi:hypothetical protein
VQEPHPGAAVSRWGARSGRPGYNDCVGSNWGNTSLRSLLLLLLLFLLCLLMR